LTACKTTLTDLLSFRIQIKRVYMQLVRHFDGA